MDNLHKGQKLTLEEAVETLTSVAEMDIDRDIAVALSNQETLAPDESLSQQIIQLIREEKFEECLDYIKEIFRVVLHYLRNYDKKDYSLDSDTIESINSIMVQVGEAAKKIDRYASIIHHEKELCVTKLKEYKKLHEFYRTRIAQKVDNGLLSKWIMGLSTRVFQQSVLDVLKTEKIHKMPSDHIFVDLDSVKNDSEYELFFIRKEDGSRFFSPRLIRNIKLICDFGKYITESRADDPLISLPLWRDYCFQENAKEIIEANLLAIEAFSHKAHLDSENELDICLNKAIMALILCSKPRNIWHDPAVKSSIDYFTDFQCFLRQALLTREHNDFQAYPSEISDARKLALNLTRGLCKSLILQLKGLDKLAAPVFKMIAEVQIENGKTHSQETLTSKILLEDYVTLSKMIKPHFAGPMINVLDELESGKHLDFDPILHKNLPNRLFSIHDNWGEVYNIHLPSPTKQESIDNVTVNEEFKECLRALHSDEKHHSDEHHLIINFQDRTSWREQARANALEELQLHDDFIHRLTVVSLPKDTEFYHQTSVYSHDNHVDRFLVQFLNQIRDETGGFYFPEEIQKDFSTKDIKSLLRSIHKVFFGKKNVLSTERRQNFIEIFYLFMQLKVIDINKPSSFSLVCKDGIDTSSAANAQLYFFLKLLGSKAVSKNDWKKLNEIIHLPALFVRERVMLLGRFTRMHNTIKELEGLCNELGCENFAKTIQQEFKGYFSEGFLTLKI